VDRKCTDWSFSGYFINYKNWNLIPCEDQHLAKEKAVRKKGKIAKSKALVISI